MCEAVLCCFARDTAKKENRGAGGAADPCGGEAVAIPGAATLASATCHLPLPPHTHDKAASPTHDSRQPAGAEPQWISQTSSITSEGLGLAGEVVKQSDRRPHH